MNTFDLLPGESNAHVVSSIVNLVCPQCGGRMSEFQCEGRCRRNWLAEWEWANQFTRGPKPQRGHARPPARRDTVPRRLKGLGAAEQQESGE
jgi:hypothetical protein